MEQLLALPIVRSFLPQGRKEIHLGDRLFYLSLKSLSVLIILSLCALVYLLWGMATPAFAKFGWGFFTTSTWNPVTEAFGSLAFIYGTVVSSLLGLLIATPVSIAVALFLNEVAPRPVGTVLGFMVEMLAAIPSVVFGIWGVFSLAPWVRATLQPAIQSYAGWLPIFQGPPYGVGMFTAGIILAIMITPTISSICREVFRTIPFTVREGALALGGTKWEMMKMAILDSSRSGIFGATVLGLGRAFGETMAVTMVIGNRPQISASLFAPAQTMASIIANEYAEASSDMHHSALAAVGLALFLVSLLFNGGARFVLWRTDRKFRSRA
ncbi:MAG TPA: phosphate ABC transporter permease subunit PstC [Bdellovibrionota bacterium]